MTIQTVAAKNLQMRLEFVKKNATGDKMWVREWFIAQCSNWSNMRIVGLPEELRALRRTLVQNAVELEARRAKGVRVLVCAIARDPHRDITRVTSISGCTAGLRLSMRRKR